MLFYFSVGIWVSFSLILGSFYTSATRYPVMGALVRCEDGDELEGGEKRAPQL